MSSVVPSAPPSEYPEPGSGSPRLTGQELEALRALVGKNLGIQLSEQKRQLVQARLQRRLSELGFRTFGQYCEYVAHDPTGQALADLASRISTNHTFFFREATHFKFLSTTVLPSLTDRLRREGRPDLRVWCAACATGEEAYTLAMLLLEHLGSSRPGWKAGLLATDISERALGAAVRGVYSADRLSDVPVTLRSKYFRPLDHGEYAVTDALKAEVTFRRLNLMTCRWPFRQSFHVIFCRNVMIYFNAPTRVELTSKLVEALAPGAYLFVGHAESLGQPPAPLRYIQPAVYRRESE